MSRTFESALAVRARVPLWIGLVGSSGSGKTMSALRLATGMSKVYGDGVFLIDTEARRSAHYAPDFRFTIVDFKAPFGPLDYLAAIEHCAARGAKTIIIDSMSHEWEGAGGVLESHDTECERLMASWKKPRDKVQMAAWQRPKAEHRRLLSAMLQMGINFITCYRAREKLKIIEGRPPIPLGWQPVASDDFVYEATVNMLLYPGSNGVPSWHPEEMGERAVVKLPSHFRGFFEEKRALDEATGEALARWAAGDAPAPPVGKPVAVTKEDVAALWNQLAANGVAQNDRLAWVKTIVGRPIERLSELTPGEMDNAMQAAKEVA